MELFAIIVDYIQPLTNSAKHFILVVSQDYEYASDKTSQNPGTLSFISQKNYDGNLCKFLPLLNSILSPHCLLPCGETLLITN